MPLQGVSLSYIQGDVNWAVLAPTIDFAIVRGGYGDTVYDAWGLRNRLEARRLGVPLAHYWYVPGHAPNPLTQAAVILTGLGYSRVGEPVALDFEEDMPGLVNYAANLALMLVNLYGSPPLIYINRDFLTRYDWRPVVALNCGLWLADWDGSDVAPENVGPWPFAAFKQKNCKTQAKGVTGAVCREVFYGDTSQFHAYGIASLH